MKKVDIYYSHNHLSNINYYNKKKYQQDMGTDKQEKWSISCSVIISHNMTVARHATCYNM